MWRRSCHARNGFTIPARWDDGGASAPGTDPAGALELWSKIEHDLVDEVPWVALGNGYHASAASRRLGNYQSAAAPAASGQSPTT